MKQRFFLAAGLLSAAPACLIASERRALRFDMGTATSPLKEGYEQVTAKTVYTKERGFGWDRPAQSEFDDHRPVPEQYRATHPNCVGPLDDPVLRDGVEDARPLTFIVDLPPGRYWVCATVGRYAHARHDMRITLNGSVAAENVDTWGHIWGSQGGSPTKSVAAVAEPKDGQFRLTFDYVAPAKDRWKEYTDREPEGGRLWFLGDNRNAIVAIRIRPDVPMPLRLEGDRLVGQPRAPQLQAAVNAFNAGRTEEAVARAIAYRPEGWYFTFADLGAVLDCLIASMQIEDQARELDLLDRSIKAWKAAHELALSSVRQGLDVAALAEARLESARRYRQAMIYLRMYAYASAKKLTGLNNYERYWAAYDLCGPFTPEDPLYYKSHLLRGRIAWWNGAEGGWKHCYTLARSHFELLQAAYPDSRIVRMYLSERVPTTKPYTAEATDAPEWARLQHEALNRYMDLIHYWVEHRQAPNGELGGNWGDDVEILRGWAPAVLAVDDLEARRGVLALAEGAWNSGEVEDGYCKDMGDVEHAAELVSDTQPLMCAVDYGNPIYIERCMANLRCMRDVWTARTPLGHRHFKAHFFSATKASTAAPQTADLALNGRACNPGIWVQWYNGHPAAREILGEWVKAWIDDAFRTEQGKPAGFVPGSVRFADERIGGFGEGWWENVGYFAGFDSVGYAAPLYHHMVAQYAFTHDERFMASLHATMEAVLRERKSPSSQAPKGSQAWAARLCDDEAVVDIWEKWRVLTGDRRYDAYLAERGSAYLRYLLSGEMKPLIASLNEVIAGLSSNIEMSTSEVLFTDRVAMPGSDILFQMMTGSVGEPTYYPLHAVTWQNTGNALAVLVERTEMDWLAAQVFHFGEHPRLIAMRPWRLTPGEYRLTLSGLDGNPVGGQERLVQLRERGETIDVALPGRRAVRIELRLVKAFPVDGAPRPDLALGPDAIMLVGNTPVAGKPVRARITVHNIGMAPAVASKGDLYEGSAKVASFTLPNIPPPLDLKPKTASVELEWASRSGGKDPLRVVIDPANEIKEIVETNNVSTTTKEKE